MSLLQLFTNNAIALLGNSITATDAVIEVQPGLGALFPQPVNPGEFFLVTLESTGIPLTREVVRVTGRTGDFLTGCVRGQEGTTATSWLATDTLVDHRITAETIRQAFLQPISTTGGGSGGVTYVPTTVPAVTTGGVSQTGYTDTSRLFKFWVEMYDPATGNAQAFEVLAIVQGILADSNETVTFTQTHNIGYNFKGSVSLTLDTVNKQLTLNWINTEPVANVVVTVTRI